MAAALALLALFLAGCAGPAAWRYEERAATAPPPARHGVHAERLRELMRGMDRLASDRLPRSMDVRSERESRVAAVARVAGAIADSADQVRGVGGELGLSDEDRRAFLALAGALGDQARALADDAPELSPSALDARLVELEDTCTLCHVRFRIP